MKTGQLSDIGMRQRQEVRQVDERGIGMNLKEKESKEGGSNEKRRGGTDERLEKYRLSSNNTHEGEREEARQIIKDRLDRNW